MALNEVISLPNPSGTYTKTIGASVTIAGTTTLQAAIAASTYVRAKNFSISLSCTGDGISDRLDGILKIGGGYFHVSLDTPSSATNYQSIKGSLDFDFDGGWLQPTDTITFQLTEIGGGTLNNVRATVSVALEDFTA